MMFRTALSGFGALVLMTGCAGTADTPMLETPLSRYVLQVEPGLDRIALAVRGDGLSANQHHAVRDLADRYRAGGTGAMIVQAPDGGDPDAARHAYAIRDALSAFGVPDSRIEVVAYAAPDPRAPVLAGFETLRAHIPDCAAVSRNMGGRFSNQSTTNFGCALTANMAAMITDPRDILGAKGMTPGDSGRAAVVFSKYRAGETSSTPQETLVEGRISSAVD